MMPKNQGESIPSLKRTGRCATSPAVNVRAAGRLAWFRWAREIDLATE